MTDATIHTATRDAYTAARAAFSAADAADSTRSERLAAGARAHKAAHAAYAAASAVRGGLDSLEGVSAAEAAWYAELALDALKLGARGDLDGMSDDFRKLLCTRGMHRGVFALDDETWGRSLLGLVRVANYTAEEKRLINAANANGVAAT